VLEVLVPGVLEVLVLEVLVLEVLGGAGWKSA
jgi:hypothetical protein